MVVTYTNCYVYLCLSQELADETNKLSDTAQFLEQQCLPLYYAETPKEMSHINANLSMNQKAGYLNMRFKVQSTMSVRLLIPIMHSRARCST